MLDLGLVREGWGQRWARYALGGQGWAEMAPFAAWVTLAGVWGQGDEVQ